MAATVAGIHLGLDTHANRPAANTVPDGSIYSCSTHSLVYKSNLAGNSWATWATLGGNGTLATVEEVDGSPTDSAVTKLVFPNGTLGIASHVATYTPTAALTIIRGAVNSGGTIAVGTGFSVSKTGTGRYTVTFSVAFSAQPIVLVQGYAAAGSQHAFIFSVPSTTAFDVETTSFGGSDTDKAFDFIAMGA